VASPWQDDTLVRVHGYAELSERFAGLSFDRGIYRLHDSVSGPRAQYLVQRCFPAHAGSRVVGYDWHGRQYAVDVDRPTATGPAVVVLNPATGEARPVARDLVDLHDRVLASGRESVLEDALFTRWLSTTGTARLERDECVGLAAPAAGAPTVGNLRLTTMERYWEACAPLRPASAELRPEVRRSRDRARVVDADLFRA
jgi:hypothetical protein